MTAMTKLSSSDKLIVAGVAILSGYLYFNRRGNVIIEDGIVSPAEGDIEQIQNNRIDIFIGIDDLHFQVAPISGTVLDIQDYPEENRNVIQIDDIMIERRGGIIARSVRTLVSVGDKIEKGARIGNILLGSHCSIWPVFGATVRPGQHIRIGHSLDTIIAPISRNDIYDKCAL